MNRIELFWYTTLFVIGFCCFAYAAGTLDVGNGSGKIDADYLDATEIASVFTSCDAGEALGCSGSGVSTGGAVNETYGSGWDSDTDPPEKDDVYDYLHAFDADDDSSFTDETWLTGLAGVLFQAYDANMITWPATIDATEVGYLNGLSEALTTSLAGKQATVTEGSLADSVIVSADIKDGEVALADMANATKCVAQSATLGDSGALTPTAGYKCVNVALTCSADPSAIVMTEGGSELDESDVIITNVGANTCTFADAAAVVELMGGVILEQYETLVLKYKSDRWVEVARSTAVARFSSINLESGTINGALRVIQQADDTYTLGTDSTADSWGTYFENSDVGADGASYTMQTAVAGMQFCLGNGQGVTEVLTVTPAAGDYLVKAGVRGTVATAYASTGAAGDEICIACMSNTDCRITKEVGTWSE